MPLREKDFNTKKEMVMQYISTASKSVSKFLTKKYTKNDLLNSLFATGRQKVMHIYYILLTNLHFL